MTYYANFRANNGTHMGKDITDTNKARLIATISSIANANRFAGNECAWHVSNEQGHCVAAGYTTQRLPLGDNEKRDKWDRVLPCPFTFDYLSIKL